MRHFRLISVIFWWYQLNSRKMMKTDTKFLFNTAAVNWIYPVCCSRKTSYAKVILDRSKERITSYNLSNMFLTMTWISCNSSRPSKVFERYSWAFFPRGFTKYKVQYLTKYIQLAGQKKRLTKILKILGKFRPFLLKKWAFGRKIDAVMLMFNANLLRRLNKN